MVGTVGARANPPAAIPKAATAIRYAWEMLRRRVTARVHPNLQEGDKEGIESEQRPEDGRRY